MLGRRGVRLGRPALGKRIRRENLKPTARIHCYYGICEAGGNGNHHLFRWHPSIQNNSNRFNVNGESLRVNALILSNTGTMDVPHCVNLRLRSSGEHQCLCLAT